MNNQSKKIIHTLALLAVVGLLFSVTPSVFADHDDDDDDRWESFYEHSRNYYDDDEYDYDDEYEDDDDEHEDYYEYTPRETAPQPAPTQKLQTLDSDGDSIIDQYDRYPGANDFLYTTDSDDDGILDAYDTHPGESDFIYLIEDSNANGIADDLERALGLL